MTERESDREDAVRHAAERDGYFLEKGIAHDEQQREYDGYRLIRVDSTSVVFGDEPLSYFPTIDDVECYLSEPDARDTIKSELRQSRHIFRPEKLDPSGSQ
jgi:hypothetical protein